MGMFVRMVGATAVVSSMIPVLSRRAAVDVHHFESANASLELTGTCTVASVANDCICNKKSLNGGSWQCSGCKDAFKWGYGCDLPCPVECKIGCDFSGNCLKPTAEMFPNCKRNGRIESPTDKTIVLNERGECQACISGFAGMFCDEGCSEKCAETAEGKCTRGGQCYECVPGYYGERCDKLCPIACPKCVMKDRLVPVGVTKGKDVEYLPAGVCEDQCATDSFGEKCDQACPKNCKKSHIPSCFKDSGLCMKCDGHKYFGPRCESTCSKGCVGGTCHKESGFCEKGCSSGFWGGACSNRCSDNCKGGQCGASDGVCSDGCNPGFWGGRCDLVCPEGTDVSTGCDRNTGFPAACVAGFFPDWLRAQPTCSKCPDNCVDGICHIDGSCSKGCELGFFGKRCDSNCAPRCDGPCDAASTTKPDGWCQACLPGWTGKKCTKRCHATCRTCEMHHNAVGPTSCTSCPADEPVFLNTTTCDCIAGASRAGADGKCACDDPSDPMKIGFFDRSRRMCRFVCKEHHWEALGNKETLCLHSDVYWSIMQGSELKQGGCDKGFKANPVSGSMPACIRQDFVDYVVKRSGKM